MYNTRLMLIDFVRAGRSLVQKITKPELPPLLTTSLIVKNRTVSYVGETWGADAIYHAKGKHYAELQARRVAKGVDLYDLVRVDYRTHRLMTVSGRFKKETSRVETVKEGKDAYRRLKLAEVKSLMEKWEKMRMEAGVRVARGPRTTPLHYSGHQSRTQSAAKPLTPAA